MINLDDKVNELSAKEEQHMASVDLYLDLSRHAV